MTADICNARCVCIVFQRSPFQLSGHCPHNRANRPVIWSYTPRRYFTKHLVPHDPFFLISFAFFTISSSSFPSPQFTMLLNSCSISIFADCPSLSNWTRGMKLQNTRWGRVVLQICLSASQRFEWLLHGNQSSLKMIVITLHMDDLRSSPMSGRACLWNPASLVLCHNNTVGINEETKYMLRKCRTKH